MQSSGALAQADTGIEAIPMLIDGTWRPGLDLCEVKDPYRGSVRALAPQSSLPDLDDALASATKGKRVAAAMPAYERAALLRRVGALINERAGHVAEIVAPRHRPDWLFRGLGQHCLLHEACDWKFSITLDCAKPN